MASVWDTESNESGRYPILIPPGCQAEQRLNLIAAIDGQQLWQRIGNGENLRPAMQYLP